MHMKKIIITLLYIIFITTISNSQEKEYLNLFDFKVTDIDGKKFDFEDLRGHKVMVVNVASNCGFTPQYKELQELYDAYKHKKFTIIGIPSNDFKNQEPGSNKEIKEFCTNSYSITFPLMEKTIVKGDSIAPLYSWLTKKEENGVFNQEVTWNFQKYLIDRNGNLVKVLMPKESPKDKIVLDWLEGD